MWLKPQRPPGLAPPIVSIIDKKTKINIIIIIIIIYLVSWPGRRLKKPIVFSLIPNSGSDIG